MNCEQALVFISAALDGELTEFEQLELGRHLDSCPECRALSEDFGVVSVALSAMNAQPPVDLIGRVNELLDEEQPTAVAPKKVSHWRKWGSMVAMLAVVLCLGGVYVFSGLGGSTANDAAAPEPKASAYMEAEVESDAAYGATVDMDEQTITEGAVFDSVNAPCEPAPMEIPQATYGMDAALTAEDAAEMVLDYLGGTEVYPDALRKGEEYLLEQGVEEETSFKTVLRYIGLSENGRYYTFQTYRETTDDFVATFDDVNHYAVKLDGSELLVERDETGSDNAEAFRTALSE